MDVLNRTLKCDRYYSGEWPREETIVVEERTPWAATYWKTLPSGFRATYLFDQQKPARLRPPEANEWFTQQNAWYRRPSWDDESTTGDKRADQVAWGARAEDSKVSIPSLMGKSRLRQGSFV